MKTRLVLAPALAVGLLLGTAGAEAAPKTLDGKKVKTLTWTATGAPQANDADFFALDGPDRVDCAPPRCAKFPFRFAPAKGVKASGLMFQATWTTPVADIDLYVAEIGKDGSYSDIGHCGMFVGTTEKVYLPRTSFKPGRTYAVIVDFYRTANEVVKATVTFPGTNSIKQSVPTSVDSLQPINCGL